MAAPPRGYTSLPGSERTPLARARLIGAADPNESVLVTVRVRPRTATAGLAATLKAAAGARTADRRYLSREEFAAAHGADPADLSKVEDFAHAHGLTVAEVNAAERSVKLLGTVSAFGAAFGVDLARYDYSGGSYRGRTGPVHVPEDLAPLIEGVFGLDDRPQARAHFRRSAPVGAVRPRTGGGTSYTPPQLARLYSFPTGVTGRGQCIAIIELGGGYRAADLKTYFSGLGIKPLPKVKSKSVDGGHNRPTGPDSADGEVMLDIEVAGGVAPGAEIVVYFAPNTDAGFLDAVRAAIHDSRNNPSVISISWGAAERYWTVQAMRDMDQAFQEAAALGVTVCCAAGDDGSSDLRGGSDGLLHVDFPASSTYALACGGTRLDAANGTIAKEVVWNEGQSGGATGGGISDVFDLPSWQKTAKVPASANPGGRVGRGVPDVAGDADPQTGYQILVDGQELVIGGTSAVAPLWAGLIALINEGLGHRAGYLNPVLYGLPATARAFRDITVGNNDTTNNGGAYPARRGWDACTGLGSPVGKKLLTALSHG
jgi:kumamolisin